MSVPMSPVGEETECQLIESSVGERTRNGTWGGVATIWTLPDEIQPRTSGRASRPLIVLE